jgi:NAD-dependent deacetylase
LYINLPPGEPFFALDAHSRSMDDTAIADLASELAAATHGVVLTGAGVSTASGIPDFRSEGGVWDRFDQRDFHYDRFLAEPAAFWADRVELQTELFSGDVGPNAAHDAIAELEASGHVEAVVTQNVDGLHAEAGSDEVVRLHGNAARVLCTDCDRRSPAEGVFDRARDGELPPRCPTCNGVLKPDTVLFGEQLPTGTLGRARDHARHADVLVAAGSSLTVEPAASLPRTAKREGATVAVVNLERTVASRLADYDVRGDVTEALPAVVEAL